MSLNRWLTGSATTLLVDFGQLFTNSYVRYWEGEIESILNLFDKALFMLSLGGKIKLTKFSPKLLKCNW